MFALKTVVSVLLVGLTSGFVQQPVTPMSLAVKSVPVDESAIGVQAPVGFWDPLGYSTTQPEGFERRRAVSVFS